MCGLGAGRPLCQPQQMQVCVQTVLWYRCRAACWHWWQGWHGAVSSLCHDPRNSCTHLEPCPAASRYTCAAACCRVVVPAALVALPAHLISSRTRRTAVCDYLTRSFGAAVGASGGWAGGLVGGRVGGWAIDAAALVSAQHVGQFHCHIA